MNVIEELRARGVRGLPKRVHNKTPSREQLEREVLKYNSELDRLALPKPQLVLTFERIVDFIGFSGQGDNSFCPSSEMVMGGRSPSYPIGDYYSCRITFKEEPIVAALGFTGWPALQRGDSIRAYIFAGERKAKKYVREGQFGFRSFVIRDYGERGEEYSVPKDSNPFVWVRRDLKSSERAIKIEKLSGSVVLAEWVDSKLFRDVYS